MSLELGIIRQKIKRLIKFCRLLWGVVLMFTSCGRSRVISTPKFCDPQGFYRMTSASPNINAIKAKSALPARSFVYMVGVISTYYQRRPIYGSRVS
jgi:hypothetical protein